MNKLYVEESVDAGEPTVSKELWEARKEKLREDVEAMFPKFAQACKTAAAASSPAVINIDQNDFGVMYTDADILLLGKLIKYAGFYKGIKIVVVDS
ncbi:hypothetical protein EBZ39_02305 [bacterium]|nr:hypothetical protein [bacterium]